MKKLIMTKGLQGSGKTTWSKAYQEKNPNTVRVNKDDLRAMLHNSIYSKGREAFVLKMRDYIVREALSEGHDVIVDDTGFNPIHEATLKELAHVGKAEFVIQDFTDIPVKECIKNDLKRPNSVGADVIWDTYNKWMKKPAQVIERVKGLPSCILCDIDGTLALFGDKNPYDRDFENDTTNEPVALLVNKLIEGSYFAESGGVGEIIFVSGRKESAREKTEKWLQEKIIGFETKVTLFMRETEDNRKDTIIKQEIFDREIRGKYNVNFVLDDRPVVCRMWRELGLCVLQVGDPDVEF